jgi:hypothetical protein
MMVTASQLFPMTSVLRKSRFPGGAPALWKCGEIMRPKTRSAPQRRADIDAPESFQADCRGTVCG